MGVSINNKVLGPSNQDLTAITREDYERYCMGVWPNTISKLEEEKKVNKFLEIKEGQEIDKINDKYFEERKSIIKNDRIYKILLKAEQEINEIYKEEDAPRRVDISYLNYVTNENSLKIDKLKQEKDKKIEEMRRKYAEVAALVEDIPAKDRIEIYKEYGILD